MAIVSVTFVAGANKTGKSTIAQGIYRMMPCSLCSIFDNEYPLSIIEALDRLKVAVKDYHVILVDNMIYKTIDYDFGNIDKFYVSCRKENAHNYVEDKPEDQNKPYWD